MNFKEFFTLATGIHQGPYPYQERLATKICPDQPEVFTIQLKIII